MTRRFLELAFAAIVAAALLADLPASAAPTGPHGETVTPATPVAKGNCATNHTGYKVSRTLQTTTSTSYVTVVDSKVPFNKAQKGCAVVSFSAEASAAASDSMLVQVLLDGTTPCQPNGNFFVTSNATATGLAARAMNYVCSSVSAGAHYIVVQFRSFIGGEVRLDYRTVEVQYER